MPSVSSTNTANTTTKRTDFYANNTIRKVSCSGITNRAPNVNLIIDSADIYQVALLWMANRLNKQIFNLPVVGKKSFSVCNTVKEWQRAFNKRMAATTAILKLDNSTPTTSPIRTTLLKDYVENVSYIQFDTYDLCYRQTFIIAKRLVNSEDPEEIKTVHARILQAVAETFYVYAKMSNIPLIPTVMIPLPTSDGSTPIFQPSYDLREMFAAESKTKRHLNTASLLKKMMENRTLMDKLKKCPGSDFIMFTPIEGSTTNQTNSLASLADVADLATPLLEMDLNN